MHWNKLEISLNDTMHREFPYMDYWDWQRSALRPITTARLQYRPTLRGPQGRLVTEHRVSHGPNTHIWNAHLGITTDLLLALFAGVGEFSLVAAETMRLVVAQDVTLTGQRGVTAAASEMARVVLLVHGTCVFLRENELRRGGKEPRLVYRRRLVCDWQ